MEPKPFLKTYFSGLIIYIISVCSYTICIANSIYLSLVCFRFWKTKNILKLRILKIYSILIVRYLCMYIVYIWPTKKIHGRSLTSFTHGGAIKPYCGHKLWSSEPNRLLTDIKRFFLYLFIDNNRVSDTIDFIFFAKGLSILAVSLIQLETYNIFPFFLSSKPVQYTV